MKRSKGRFRKRFFWIVGIILALFLVFNIALRLLFPESKIRTILSEQIYKATGRPFEVDRITWSIFGALDLEGVRLGFTEEENRPNEFVVQMEYGRLRFRLLPLIKRQLQIADILLDSPQVHLIPAVLAPPDTASHATISTPDTARSQTVQTDIVPTEQATLPISMGLFKFQLRDFGLRMSFPDTSQLHEIALSGLNVEVQDLYIPNEVLESQKALRAQVRVFTRNSQLSLDAMDVSAEWKLNLDLGMVWGREERWRIRGGTHLLPEKTPSDSLYFDLDVEGQGLGLETRIRYLTIGLGPWRPVRMTGNIRMVKDEPDYQIQIGGDVIDLAEIQAFLLRTIPAPYSDPLHGFSLSGRMSLLSGHVRGSGLNVQAELQSRLEGFEITAQQQSMFVGPISYGLDIDGAWTPDGLQSGQVQSTVTVDQVSAPMNDTTMVSVKNIQLLMSSNLNTAFYPASGQIRADIGDLFQSRINLGLSWEAAGLPDLTGLQVDGELNLDSLYIENLPVPDLPFAGRTGAGLSVHSGGLDSITVELSGFTSGLQRLTDYGRDNLPDYNWMAELYVKTDNRFSSFDIPVFAVRLGELFLLNAKGHIHSDPLLFQAEVLDAYVDNEKFLSYLPEQTQGELAHLTLSGKEVFSGRLSGQIADSIPTYTLSAELGLQHGGLIDTLSGLSVLGVEGSLQVSGNQDRVEGSGLVRAKSLILDALGPDPVKDGHIQFNFGMKHTDSLWINEGLIRIDAMGLLSEFGAELVPDDSIPRIDGTVQVAMSSDRWKEIIPGSRFKGAWEGQIQASNTQSALNQIQLEGHVSFDSLFLDQQNLMQIVNANGRIPMQILADTDGHLVPESQYEPISWIEYEERQDLIRALWSKDKRLQIDSLKINAYAINHVRMDMDFSHGMIQIPSFQMHMFEGNLGGSLWFDPADGMPENMRYGIRAQASRINSAALTENEKLKETTELNANMAFTGQGLDVSKNMELDGYFHITQVGPKFASTLLKGMDPNGSDRSIRLTRHLLDLGWKPELFSFELRHGHVYPSLSLSQPWFSPIRIPGRLEYGRIPFAFFLTQQVSMTQ